MFVFFFYILQFLLKPSKHKTHLWSFDLWCILFNVIPPKMIHLCFSTFKELEKLTGLQPVPSAHLWIHLWRVVPSPHTFSLVSSRLIFQGHEDYSSTSTKIYSYCGYFLLVIPCWKPETKATCEPPILWSGWTFG